MSGTPLLEARSISKRFGGLKAVDDVSFDVRPGEIFGLIGPNGAGKTTCFNVLAGVLRPTSGRILLRGEDVTGLRPDQLAARGLGRTFQQTDLFQHLTVADAVAVGCHLRGRQRLWQILLNTRDFRWEEAEIRERARAIAARLGLGDALEREARSLPYGDQRKLGIAMALASDPQVMLLDEPAAGLNGEESRQLKEIIASINADGISIVLIEHDMSVVMDSCHRILVLDHGRMVAEGTPAEIAAHEDVIRVYLGSGRQRGAAPERDEVHAQAP